MLSEKPLGGILVWGPFLPNPLSPGTHKHSSSAKERQTRPNLPRARTGLTAAPGRPGLRRLRSYSRLQEQKAGPLCRASGATKKTPAQRLQHSPHDQHPGRKYLYLWISARAKDPTTTAYFIGRCLGDAWLKGSIFPSHRTIKVTGR